jgi:hypothetical protein
MVMGFVPFSPRFPEAFGEVRVAWAGRECRDYQEDLVTPGSSPRCAISRTQMRQRPNTR